MGRKKPCAANEGICDLLIRLAELPGLLFTWLDAAMELLAGGGPLRDTEGCERGGCDDAPVMDCVRSPSSEVISVIRDDTPPIEGGRGIPNACCDGGGFVASPVSGVPGEYAIVSMRMCLLSLLPESTPNHSVATRKTERKESAMC